MQLEFQDRRLTIGKEAQGTRMPAYEIPLIGYQPA